MNLSIDWYPTSLIIYYVNKNKMNMMNMVSIYDDICARRDLNPGHQLGRLVC